MPETPAPTAAAETPAPATKKKSRQLGNWSFNLGILALLAEIGLYVSVWLTVWSIQAGLDAGEGTDVAPSSVALIEQIAAVVFWAGLVLALLAVVLGIAAIASDRGRASGVWGLLFGLVVLVLRLLAFLSILNFIILLGGGFLD